MLRPAVSGRARSVTAADSTSVSVGSKPRRSSLTPRPRKTITANRRKSTGSSIPAMDRNTMMVLEANEISAYLQKDFEFSKKDENDSNNTAEMRIKVLNKKLGISCTWSLEKLKERLVKMRKLMYSNENDILAGDAVFFDPADTWEKENSDSASNTSEIKQKEVINTSVVQTRASLHSAVPDVIDVKTNKIKAVAERPLSPQQKTPTVTQRLTRKPNSNHSSLGSTQGSVPELPAESEFILTRPSPDILTNGVHPEKCLVNTNKKQCNDDTTAFSRSDQIRKESTETRSLTGLKEFTDDFTQTATCEDCSVLNICMTMVDQLGHRLKGQKVETEFSLVDRILSTCESIKTLVINILSAYTEGSSFEIVNSSSIQLVTAMNLLVFHTSDILSQFIDGQSAMLSTVKQSLKGITMSMTDNTVSFLKGIKDQDEDLVHDSASDLIDCLFEVVQICGELSLASETFPIFLHQESIEELMLFNSTEERDILQPKCSIEIKQSLLSGCEKYVENRLEETLKVIRSSEAAIEDQLHDLQSSEQHCEEILKHTEIVIASAKILVLKFQEVQGEISADMRTVSETKAGSYFKDYFERCQCTVSVMNNLSGSLGLLNQAAQTSVTESEAGSLRKVSRCAEMVSRSCYRLLQPASESGSSFSETSFSSATSDSSPDYKSNYSSWQSVFSDEQIDKLDKAISNVKTSVQSLIGLVKKSLSGEPMSTGKIRRMLPVTPSSGSGLVRTQSARVRSATERNKVSRRLSMIDNNRRY